MLAIEGVHHIAIIASDLDRSLAFYCDSLGFVVIDRNFRDERNSWKIDLRHPSGVGLELFTFPDAPPRPNRPEARGLRHLAFAVRDVADAAQKLTEAGNAVEPIRTDPYTGRKFTFLADPDGVPIELYEDPGKRS